MHWLKIFKQKTRPHKILNWMVVNVPRILSTLDISAGTTPRSWAGRSRNCDSYPGRCKKFISCNASRGLWGTTSLLFNRYGGGALSPGTKRPEPETDHSPHV